MLKSMTGFGRASVKTDLGTLTVEIQSVNRKFLEVAVALPREFSRFEMQVRKQVASRLSRGAVSVRIFLNAPPQSCLPNVEMLKAMKKEWDQIASAIGSDPKAIDLPFLMQYLPQAATFDQELPELQDIVHEALSQLAKMREAEGKALFKDLSEKLTLLSSYLEKIEEIAPGCVERMRAKLQEKLEVLGADMEERLLREVAIFAEKADIAEEITRLKSHFSQFKALLKGGEVGRKMDFLIQEMGREINTIGSKSSEVKISQLVVEMKSELEKMREQTQNLE